MSYHWTSTEVLTAEKLNKMQQQPLMYHINNAGVQGGLDGSSLSMETIGCDLGTRIEISSPVQTGEHERGNYKMEYETSTEQWQLKSGSSGVTGVVAKDAGTGAWLLTCTNSKATNWHHIKTDKWGNVLESKQVLDECGHTTVMWDPGTTTGNGEIWRRMGTVEKDERFKCLNSCATRQWIYTATNENNALILPVARRVGWNKPGAINVCNNNETKNRLEKSHWAPTVFPDKGATVPIQGAGELGGTFVYNAIDGGNNTVGIGIASGIEFYDKNTIACKNNNDPRPKSTTARVDFGECGKNGYIQISNINPLHPWQFELTGELDIGTGGGGCFDPGTDWFNTQIEEGKVPYANSPWSYNGAPVWQEFSSDDDYIIPEGCGRDGIISARSIKRVYLNRDAELCRPWSEIEYRYTVGDIIDGQINIGTALQIWPNEQPGCVGQDYSNPRNCAVRYNPNGGTVTGIINDNEGWPTIDTYGVIHLPDRKYMGNHFVAKAVWMPWLDPSLNQVGVISCIHNELDAQAHFINNNGDIRLAGAKFNQPGINNTAGIIYSFTMTCANCQPRICNGTMYIPKSGGEVCKATYYPGICSVNGTVQSIVWHDDITYIDHGDVKLGTAHWSKELGDHFCDRTGGIKDICVVGAKYACIQNGTILIDIGTSEPVICKANYQPLYPQFNKPGIISTMGWCDDYDKITQGNIFAATANWDPGSNGWMQPQRTGGVKAVCWGVSRNKPAIDNGNLIMPVATYYPCNTGPAGVQNRPGLIRGVKAVDCLLPAPYIDECGYLHIRA